MADRSQKNQDVSSEVGIPSGLNRIRTQRGSSKDQLSSKPDELTDSRSYAALRPPVKSKKKCVAQRQGKITDSSKEERKGKKISKWFTSYISRNSSQLLHHGPPSNEDVNSESKTLEEEESTRIKQFSADSACSSKVPKGLKSFSHELGPRGGIQSAYPRAHSYTDLKDLLGSLHSRFDAAKEIVNVELAGFAGDVVDVIEKTDSSYSEEQKIVENLLVLAQNCVEMTCSQFRAKCESIVQDLTEKRQQCQTGMVRWLFTRMLFILTRCTRLLMFQKEREPIDEKSLHKFKKCLDSIPAVEMSWVPTSRSADSGSSYPLYQRLDAQSELQEQTRVSSLSETGWCSSTEAADQNDQPAREGSMVPDEKSPTQKSQFDFLSEEQQFHLGRGSYEEKLLNDSGLSSLKEQQQCLVGLFNEPEQNLDGSNSVICRICEEGVPIAHLESHSYICAYADKCELNCADVNERLSKLEELLEQIIESRNLSAYPPIGSPEISRIQSTNSAMTPDGYSPKINEWRNKGVEGMFEDIHEMDTACIDDSHLNPINFKSHLGLKLCSYGASSSTGSMTSVSSTNTPRTSHFDSFWLERNNPSEQEDVQQMIDLADIARCVAGTDLSTEGSCDYLLACMQDLQDVLKQSKMKALVIDTFGSRIEKLLREKYILACEVMDGKSPISHNKHSENSGMFLDSASQSSVSTPPHLLHKDRTSIDDFEIIRPISRGAFGKVFLARKRTTGDLFAIKVLKKLDMIRKNDIERILAERNILITVRNPFVVRFFYSFTCRDNLYLVMEYLNGGDLYSLLRKVGCLEEDVARIYIAELVLALEYLHSLGIVHRDLKPDNILIAHDGHMKLTDFGLSKIGLINNTINLSGPETDLTRASDAHSLHVQQTEDTNRHSAVGTPDYLAPEILLGTEHGLNTYSMSFIYVLSEADYLLDLHAGYAADWWSVGIILFELITGIPPFSAERPEIIFDNILNRKIPWPHVPGDMSYEAQDFINRFLVHDPTQRLGANGSAEVKSHPFFKGVNWDNLALQKAVFVPQPDSIDDTSYFVSRFSHISSRVPDDEHCSNSGADSCDLCSDSGDEIDECGDLTEFASFIDLSLMNFSFKNLSQLASINHEVLLQNGKDSTKGSSSPSKGLGT